MFRWSGVLLLWLLWHPYTLADPLVFQSGPERAQLLELYTSEGCSSCPRADRWLSELEADPGLWQTVVPVAFHVDYWDYIGWQDQFAEPEYGKRQRRYARQGRASGVYTPGLFVDGREWKGWWRDGKLPADTRATGLLSARVNGSEVAIQLSGTHVPPVARAYVAVLGMDQDTAVRAGENRGRTLTQDFVVLQLLQASLAGNATAQVSIDRSPGAGRLALAAWVTDPDGLEVLQATGGWLPELDR